MGISVSLLIVFPIIALLCIAVAAMIGVYVFKDSKSRGMNAPLWTIISIFAPGFIGLIIYLIVRTSYSALKCPQCGRRVDESFSVCPNCAAPLKSVCDNCSMPLDPSWQVCPNCATPIPPEKRNAHFAHGKSDKKLSALVIAAIAISLVVCIAVASFATIFLISCNDNGTFTISSSLEKREVKNTYFEKWIAECDKKGKGLYVLTGTAEPEQTDLSTATTFIFYKNDGGGSVNNSSIPSKLFGETTVDFIIDGDDSEENSGYILQYYYFESNKPLSVGTVKDENDKAVDANITKAGKNIESDFEKLQRMSYLDTVWIDINLSKSVSDIQSISMKKYHNGKTIESGSVVDAAGDALSQTVSFYFDITEPETDTVSFEMTDSSGKVVFKSEKIKVIGGKTYAFNASVNENGYFIEKAA